MPFVNVISPNGLVQPDPIGQLQKFAGAQNALNENTTWKQQNANRLAVSQAYQDATDPDTGVVDPVKFQKSILSNPDTAMFAPETLQNNQKTQDNQYKLNAADTAQTQTRLNSSTQFLAPLLAKDPSQVSAGDVYQAVGAAHAAGFNTDPLTNEMAVSMPHPAPGQDPAAYGKQLQSWARGQVSTGIGAQGELNEFTSDAGAISTGGRTQFYDKNPVTNPDVTSQSYKNTLSPEAQVSTQPGTPGGWEPQIGADGNPVVGPDGQPQMKWNPSLPTVMTGRQVAQRTGQSDLLDGGQGAPAPGAVTTQSLAPPGDQGGGPRSAFAHGGRYQIPSALRNPNGPAAGGNQPAPQGGSGAPPPGPTQGGAGVGPDFSDPTIYPSGNPNAPVAPPAPTGGPPAMAGGAPASVQSPPMGGNLPPAPGGAPAPLVVGQAPGVAEAQRTVATNGADQSVQLVNSAQSIPNRQALYDGLEGDLTSSNTGPSSGITDAVRGRLVQVGQAFGVDPGSISTNQSANENFKKLANQLVTQSSAALGGAMTNDKLAVAEMSGPNPSYTKLGNLGVIHILRANDDALNVKANAWQQAQANGVSPANYSQWSSQFNQGFSVTPFWYARMSNDERSRFISGMTPAQQAQLKQGIDTAINNKWIPPSMFLPQGQQTAQAGTPAPASGQ